MGEERKYLKPAIWLTFNSLFETLRNFVPIQRRYHFIQRARASDHLQSTRRRNWFANSLSFLLILKNSVLPISFLQSPIAQPGETAPMYAIYSTLGITVFQMLSKVGDFKKVIKEKDSNSKNRGLFSFADFLAATG